MRNQVEHIVRTPFSRPECTPLHDERVGAAVALAEQGDKQRLRIEALAERTASPKLKQAFVAWWFVAPVANLLMKHVSSPVVTVKVPPVLPSPSFAYLNGNVAAVPVAGSPAVISV